MYGKLQERDIEESWLLVMGLYLLVLPIKECSCLPNMRILSISEVSGYDDRITLHEVASYRHSNTSPKISRLQNDS